MAPDGRGQAATRIAAWFRGRRVRRAYLEYRRKKWAAGVIAVNWIMCVRLVKIRKLMHEKRLRHLESSRRRAKVHT